MRHKTLPGHIIKVGKVTATSPVLWFSIGVSFKNQFSIFTNKLALHVTTKVKVTSMSNAFKLSVFAIGKEREGILNISRST